MGILIDGRAIATEIRARIRDDIARWGRTPGLAIVIAGAHPASMTYVRRKAAACAEVGIRAEILALPAATTEGDLLATISACNARPEIHGVIVQRPLPSHCAPAAIAAAIAPAKDVDGLHPENVGLLWSGRPRFIPATPKGIRALLLRSGRDPAGRHVVIVGRGELVGRPLAALLLQRGPGGDATVTVCHTGTRDLAAITRTADILVAAIGRPRLITGDMVRPGAIVVDVGINRIADPASPNGTRTVGDVDTDAVRAVADAVTPVPGGVGPMTVAMLLENVVEAAMRSGE